MTKLILLLIAFSIVAIIIAVIAVKLVNRSSNRRYYKRKKVSCNDMANIIGVMADDSVDHLLSFADLSSFEEKDIHIAKGYFELFYTAIMIINLRLTKTIKGEFVSKISDDVIYHSIGMNDMDFGSLVYDDNSEIPLKYYNLYKTMIPFVANCDIAALLNTIRSEIDESIYNAIDSKISIRGVLLVWLKDAIDLSKKFRVII